MLGRVRFSIVATLLVVVASACVPAPVAPTATATPAVPSFVAAPSATAAPSARRITRPVAAYGGDPPILLRALPEAGTFASRSGQWRYDGVHGTLEQAPTIDEPLEHPAPSGTLVAIEHQGRTPGGYAISNELAIRDGLADLTGSSIARRSSSTGRAGRPMAGTSRSGRSTSTAARSTSMAVRWSSSRRRPEQGSRLGGHFCTAARPGHRRTRWPSSPVSDEPCGTTSGSSHGRPRTGSGT